MTTFGLVHGAWHGAWCWDALIPQLRSRGHDAVAMDLPCEEKETATTSAYVRSVRDALEAAGAQDDVVLVGHSLGGITIPVVAAERSVRGLVYLCAILRDPGRSLHDGPASGTDADMFVPGFGDDVIDLGHGCSMWPEDGVATRHWLYHDCEPRAAANAASKLRRQYTLWFEPSPIDEMPDVPVASILCTEERSVNPAWSRRVAAERLGVTAIELPGGHSPMLSRPATLAEVLTTLPFAG